MMIAGPVQFLESKALADLGAVAVGNSTYLISLENSYDMVPSPVDAPAQRMRWRFWKPNADSLDFSAVSEGSAIMPVAKAISIAVQNNHLIALLQVNEPRPAYLLTWEIDRSSKLVIPTSAPDVVPVALGEPEAEQVQLDITQDWSTRGLPSSRWLFSGGLSSFPGSDHFGIAMTTADAHGIAWLADGKTPLGKPVWFYPDALDPVFLRLQGKDYLFHRKPSVGWSVFFHDVRYSGQYGPVGLPLMVAERLADGTITARELGQGVEMGAVFAFDIVVGGSDRFVLSVIGGTKEQPQLFIYLSDDLGHTFYMRQAKPLRGVPYRIVSAMADSDLLVGLAYKTEVGYLAEGISVTMD